MLSYGRLSKKPILFKSFTGLTVHEFDGIHNKKIQKICHMRYNAYLKEETDIFKKMWIRLLEEYDHKKGIKWTLQSILDSISIKSPLW
jgi:hypothetical protein